MSSTGGRFAVYATATVHALVALGWPGQAANPQGGSIVVCSFRTGDLELFAVDPASGDARNPTRTPSSADKYPACSFAGDWLALISNRDGTDDLYVMNPTDRASGD